MILSANERFDDDDLPDEEPLLPHLEPIFWGCSDLLIWDFARLLKTIDIDSVMASDSPLAGGLDDTEKLDLQVMFDALSKLDENSDFQIRGSYGFFPVIFEKGGFVILDPVNFHTELVALPAPALTEKGQTAAKKLAPDGDVIAIAAVSFGPLYHIIEQLTENRPHEKTLAVLSHTLATSATERLLGEIKRGLGIETGHFSSNDTIIADVSSVQTMYEFMSFEERLGIEPALKEKTTASLSVSGIFFHQN